MVTDNTKTTIRESYQTGQSVILFVSLAHLTNVERDAGEGSNECHLAGDDAKKGWVVDELCISIVSCLQSQ